MKRRLYALAALILLASVPAWAALYHVPLSATATPQSKTFDKSMNTVTLHNLSSSAQTVYFQLYWCDETAWPADTNTETPRLAVGESITIQFNPNEHQGGRSGYCTIVYVTSTSTATLDVLAK